MAASDFFIGGSRFFSLGPAIRWPIFNAGRIRQNIKVQNLWQEQALLAYEQALLIALEEVENALVAYRQAQLRLHQLTEAEKAQQRAVMLAHDRYRSGLVDFLDVLEAERSLHTSQAPTSPKASGRWARTLFGCIRRWAVAGRKTRPGSTRCAERSSCH